MAGDLPVHGNRHVEAWATRRETIEHTFRSGAVCPPNPSSPLVGLLGGKSRASVSVSGLPALVPPPSRNRRRQAVYVPVVATGTLPPSLHGALPKRVA